MGRLPQTAGSPGLNGGGAAAAVPQARDSSTANQRKEHNVEKYTFSAGLQRCR